MWFGMLVCVGGHVYLCGWACLFVWLGMLVCVGGPVYLCGWHVSLCGWALLHFMPELASRKVPCTGLVTWR